MDAALVRERVPPDDRLVVLHRERGDGGDELRRPRQHGGVDIGPVRHHVVAHAHRHHRFFQRGVAGAFADAVDGALDLPGAGAHAGERIRHRHAEIVMAMHGKPRLVGIRHPLAHHLDQREIFLRHRVADGVGNIDRAGAGLNRGLDAAAEEIVLGSGAVLARPFDVVGVAARPRHRGDHHLKNLLGRKLQLPLHVHRRGGDEGMDARLLRRLDRLAGAVNVLETGAGEPADDGVLGALGDLVDGGEIAVGGDRKAGFDDVDAHLIEQLGDFELLLVRHGGAGALLAVAQGGVEDDDAVLLGFYRRGHDVWSFSFAPASRGLGANLCDLLGSVAFGRPLSAQAQTPSRPSGGAKKQEPAKNLEKHEGGAGRGLSGRPGHRANTIAARRHCQSPRHAHKGRGSR